MTKSGQVRQRTLGPAPLTPSAPRRPCETDEEQAFASGRRGSESIHLGPVGCIAWALFLGSGPASGGMVGVFRSEIEWLVLYLRTCDNRKVTVSRGITRNAHAVCLVSRSVLPGTGAVVTEASLRRPPNAVAGVASALYQADIDTWACRRSQIVSARSASDL
ncbi:hypothetical protein AAFF_G00359590 [Aldrovandia affinis]|uniref:Uncharacterized protein n=1 Tax=Aldrovandia affinis TaxID=143900 RepID=A0AAD7SI91_9TELE|nr:hypothetical protein AAFF_G00359590 [Aldrovandia affinis]